MRINKEATAALVLVLVMISSGIMTFDVIGSDADSVNVIEVSYEHGRLIDKASGLDYNGGEFSGELALQFIPNRGYEFISWHIPGA